MAVEDLEIPSALAAELGTVAVTGLVPAVLAVEGREMVWSDLKQGDGVIEIFSAISCLIPSILNWKFKSETALLD